MAERLELQPGLPASNRVDASQPEDSLRKKTREPFHQTRRARIVMGLASLGLVGLAIAACGDPVDSRTNDGSRTPLPTVERTKDLLVPTATFEGQTPIPTPVPDNIRTPELLPTVDSDRLPPDQRNFCVGAIDTRPIPADRLGGIVADASNYTQILSLSGHDIREVEPRRSIRKGVRVCQIEQEGAPVIVGITLNVDDNSVSSYDELVSILTDNGGRRIPSDVARALPNNGSLFRESRQNGEVEDLGSLVIVPIAYRHGDSCANLQVSVNTTSGEIKIAGEDPADLVGGKCVTREETPIIR